MRSLNHTFKYGMTLGLLGLVTFCIQQASAAERDACCDTSDGTCTDVNATCIGCSWPDVCNSSTACASTTDRCKISGVCTDVNSSCRVQTCGMVPSAYCRLTSNRVCTLVSTDCNSECEGPTNQCILYVDKDATGLDDGSSWTHAYSKLQDALDDAVADDEIWVAEGTYYPDEGASVTADDRDASFVMVDGLEMYGGFRGKDEEEEYAGETSRVPTGGATILSGDIKQDDGTALVEGDCSLAGDPYGEKGWDGSQCLYVHEVRRHNFGTEVTGSTWCDLYGGEWDNSHDPRCYFVSRQCSGGSNPGMHCTVNGDCAGGGTCVADIEQPKNLDNSIHVVTVDETMNNVVIDGFTITAGNANRKACLGGTYAGNICLDDGDCEGGGEDGTCSKVCVGGADDGDICTLDSDCAAPSVCTHDLLGSQGGGIINRDPDDATAINNVLTVRDCIFDGNHSRNHGAFNDHGTATIIDECEFKDNRTGRLGAGLYTHKDSDATVTDCTFTGNYSGDRGGGMYVNSDATTASAVDVADCEFSNNKAFTYSGGLNGAAGSVVTVSGTVTEGVTTCEFRGNSAIGKQGEGGAIWIDDSTLSVTDCVFEANTGVRTGAVSSGGETADSTFTRCAFWKNKVVGPGTLGGAGACHAYVTTVTLDDCDFIENQAPSSGAVKVDSSSFTITNSRFVRNKSVTGHGGALTLAKGGVATPSADLTNCVFVDNDGANAGAVMVLFGDLDAVNCLFVRNEATGNGGAIRVAAAGATAAIVNSTIADNVADSGGGGIHNSETITVDNSILWDNLDNWDSQTSSYDNDESSQLDNSGTATVTYTDWKDHSGGTGNIGEDEADNPDFIGSVETGTWGTVDGYDADTGTTTFNGSGWTADELVDLILQPDTSLEEYTIITANTTTKITAWGDFGSCSSSCSSFDIFDYRLVDPDSPCIDTGTNTGVTDGTDPGDLDGNDRIVGDYVDMGCYEVQ